MNAWFECRVLRRKNVSKHTQSTNFYYRCKIYSCILCRCEVTSSQSILTASQARSITRDLLPTIKFHVLSQRAVKTFPFIPILYWSYRERIVFPLKDYLFYKNDFISLHLCWYTITYFLSSITLKLNFTFLWNIFVIFIDEIFLSQYIM